MRSASPVVSGVAAKAYAGTTGVLLAMDVEPAARTGLLGFAIERETLSGPSKGRTKWLEGMVNFPGLPHFPGQPAASRAAPFQKFRWSDYTVFPGTDYAYTVHPVHGLAGKPDIGAGPRLPVKTLDHDTDHFAIFNRAVAASQAFSREFPQIAIDLYAAKKAGKKLSSVRFPPEAYEWLSRGLLEHILGFLASARDGTWFIDIAIYEYELMAIRQAVADAAQRGVQIRILYHAEPGDKHTQENKRFKRSDFRRLFTP